MKLTVLLLFLSLIIIFCNLEKIPDEPDFGTITELNCSGAKVSGTLISGRAVSSTLVLVPYIGGDGGSYSNQIVISTGVSGLTATLAAGNFEVGSDSLEYSISGTPLSSGNAVFELSIGGRNCTLSIPVHSESGTVGTLNCTSVTLAGALYAGQEASNVTFSVPYSGGNGGPYTSQLIGSTGVDGLKAQLKDSIFNVGNGLVVYTVTGTPTIPGTATFAINVGGKSCEVGITVGISTGSISVLDCGSTIITGSIFSGISTNGLITVPYNGGNGGTHGGQTVMSSGVTGLVATLGSGSFANGSGTVQYTISGVPSSSGTASFLLNIGGKNCTVTVPVIGGSIEILNCLDAVLNTNLFSGQPANTQAVLVPYYGGNGGAHLGQTVNSSAPGVIGLTATLESGYFTIGNGYLNYKITGTPTADGTALFALNIGGEMCTVSVPVQEASGTVSMLNCGAATLSNILTEGVSATGITATVPYLGGNGGVYSGQAVPSTGVNGLTATVLNGSFTNGNGELIYTLNGTPSSEGTASFALNIGGQMCTLHAPIQAGSISSLQCSSYNLSSTLTAGVSVAAAIVNIPYLGGNGGIHSGQTVTSTGVSGLTATLSPGSFGNGIGSLSYFLSGIPSSEGTASFALNIGGQMCMLQLPVLAGSINALECSSYNLSGTLTAGVSADGVDVTIPYLGGNGGTHSGQAVTSTGVIGLTATLSPGSFVNGNGSLSYSLSGVPSSGGTASFMLNVGGEMCTLTISVLGQCHAKVSATQWKTFFCYNLGAANTSIDPLIPNWEINGGYWQWGRKAQAASGPTGPASSQANNGSISSWNTSYAPNGSWLDNSKTSNDPCPQGYRVPTRAQLDGIINYNNITNVGSWTDNIANYGSGKKFGDNLFLPAAGYRLNSNGMLSYRGTYAVYWSSGYYGTEYAWYLFFSNVEEYTGWGYYRTRGASIRCISE